MCKSWVKEGAHIAVAACDRKKGAVTSLEIILEVYARLLSARGLLLLVSQRWLTPVKPVALQVHVGAVVVAGCKRGLLQSDKIGMSSAEQTLSVD